ncbi:hypothetical protein Acr_10g0000390 [Actinidia rufa]|uniref:Uncharacterized protein n=1 Tax=Actinidia rufa TaxID=165716 RepID=A0A7J0F7J1_9ERIC|nr:hypothetical protein Acr_10g0000390 [Actinidia rufa]
MKRVSQIILLFFVCFVLCVPQGFAAREIKPDWSWSSGGTWGPSGSRGGGCSSWRGCWTWGPSGPSPTTPAKPTPATPSLPTPAKPTPTTPATPSPPVQKPPSQPGGFFDAIQCGMTFGKMGICTGQYYASGGYISQDCCNTMKEMNAHCGFAGSFGLPPNACH